MRRTLFFMPRKKRAVGKAGRCPAPCQGDAPWTPARFPSASMFQNGPRRQGCAPENLFKSTKDFPPPRTKRAPLPAPGRSERFPIKRESGQMQSASRLCAASRWSATSCTTSFGVDKPS